MIKISPSILSSDFTQIAKVIRKLDLAGADFIHLDIMDGNFVPQISFGSKMVKDIKKITKLPLDVHLMILKPENHIDKFIDAGSDIITFHIEACDDAKKLINKIKAANVKAGISIKPKTKVYDIEKVLGIIDMVLVMTVEPGYGGQSLINDTLKKVSRLREIKESRGYHYDIQVDGGINSKTYKEAIDAGANIFVAGSAITNSDDYKLAMDGLRG